MLKAVVYKISYRLEKDPQTNEKTPPPKWDCCNQYFSSYAQKVILTLNLYVFCKTEVYYWPVPYQNTLRHPGY